MDADQIDDMPSNINIGPISIFNSNNYGNSITLVNIILFINISISINFIIQYVHACVDIMKFIWN